jgi:hypothetical protein
MAAPKTQRDKLIESRKQAAAVTRNQSLVKSIDDEIQKLSTQLIVLDDQIAVLQRAVESAGTPEQLDAAKKGLATAQSSRSTVNAALISAQLGSVEIKAGKDSNARNVTTALARTVTALSSTALSANPNPTAKELKYNASAVKEAYFSTKTSFLEGVSSQTANRERIGIQSPDNLPASITQANQLWTAASGSKGMIVTSEQVLKAWNSGSNAATSSNSLDHHNYGFQFQYNPGNVSMSYYTSPNVDVTMITSGTEMFNLAGVSGSQGSVSFQVIINRIFDMQYYKSDGSLKDSYNFRDIYPVPPKYTQDGQDIYEHGTMYDVEYLLRVLMGTTMSSYLRGKRTADMGWLPAIPVELHLGNNLRYLGTVNNINLNHIIFDSRMVPLFTTMDIGFARLPDYPPSNTTPNTSNTRPYGFRGN